MPGKPPQRRKPRHTKEEIGRALERVRQGRAVKEVAETTGIPRSTIRHWIENPRQAEDSEVLAWMAIERREWAVESTLWQADAVRIGRELLAAGNTKGSLDCAKIAGILEDKVPGILNSLSRDPKPINAADGQALVVLPGDKP